MKGKQIEQEKEKMVTTKFVSSSQSINKKKFDFDLAALIRTLHEVPSQRLRDESTPNKYVDTFIFKHNNTLFVTMVSLKKGLKEPENLEVHTQKMKICKIEPTSAEWIDEFNKTAMKMKESQKTRRDETSTL